ncbi:MAG: deoxyribose-phosphate aldolase [Rikenellaceae bacterium]
MENNTTILEGFATAPTQSEVNALLESIKSKVSQNTNSEVYKLCYSLIDLTTLASEDSIDSVRSFARSAVDFLSERPDIPPVASLCVYPPFVEVVGLEIDGTPLKITAVAGGFPSSQTFMEVKALESAMAVESGADEIDVVLNVGMMLSGRYEEAQSEIALLRDEVGADTVLKVILESGALAEPSLIYIGAMLSMCAGTDFVKTSTGKQSPAATPEAAVVMCLAIKEFYEKRGAKIGFKAAGGIRTAQDAALYYTIVGEILGEGWLTPDLFRLGASSLAAELVAEIDRS